MTETATPTVQESDLADMLEGYVTAALWSSTDDDGDPLDDRFGVTDLAPEALTQMKEDCERFATTHFALIEEFQDALKRYDWSYIGHDLWLTRNGHGAGFWDRISSKVCDAGHKLSKFCGHNSEFPPQDLYVGDDGKLRV